MLLVDTSVWVDHLRMGNIGLEAFLIDGEILSHPFIIGELACGTVKNREEILFLLQSLPEATVADHEEVLLFIEKYKLMGKGLGYIDLHLLASALLSKVPLWTFDKKLEKISIELGLNFVKS